MDTENNLPIVYACSGCSSVAQLANDMAIKLDRLCKAEMSCISGVGGEVAALVRVAKSGRPILAIDGCALACAKACLSKVGVTPDRHLILNRQGAKKRFHAACNETEAAAIWQLVDQAATELNVQPESDVQARFTLPPTAAATTSTATSAAQL